ncbi:MAG: phage major capsid protein [Actinomycetota bacterium]
MYTHAQRAQAGFEERRKAVSELRALYRDAEGRDLNADETATEVRLNETIDELDEAIAFELRAMVPGGNRERVYAALAEAHSSPETRARHFEEANPELVSVLRGETRGVDIALPDWEARDLTTGAANAGAEHVPTNWASELVVLLEDGSGIFDTARRIITPGGNPWRYPTVTGHGTAEQEVAEGALIGENEPTTGDVTFEAYKYATLIQASIELVEDAQGIVNVADMVREEVGFQLPKAFGPRLATGTGTDQPTGLFTATSDVTAAATGAVTVEELIDLQHSLDKPYRRRAVFVMNDTTARDLRKLRLGGSTATDGEFMWQPSTQLGQPDTLLGTPVVIDDYAPDFGASATPIVIFDPTRFAVRVGGGLRIERSDDFAFANDLVTFRAVIRLDSHFLDAASARALTMAAA